MTGSGTSVVWNSSLPTLANGTIVAVHSLRNHLFLPEHGLGDVPLMVSVADVVSRPYLRRSIARGGIKAHLGVRGPVLIDSGGFSLMAGRHAPIAVDDIIALYRVLDADVYAAPDLPPGLEDDASTRLAKWRMTLAHLECALAQFDENRLMPVIHGRTLDEIALACRDVRGRIHQPPIIALGGMVPFLRGLMSPKRFRYQRIDGSTGSGETFVADALALCRAEFSQSRLHVFGVGSPTTAIALFALGADSTDSLAWRRAAGYGTIFLAGCAERIVSARKRQHASSRPRVSRADQAALEACGCPMCSPHRCFEGRVTALANSYVARGIHNVWTLRNEEIAFRQAKTAGVLASFVASRVRPRHRFSKVIRAQIGSAPFVAPVGSAAHVGSIDQKRPALEVT